MLYYALITIALAITDALRIKWRNARIKKPIGNNDISHGVSAGLAIVTAAILGLIVRPHSWHILTFAIGCIAIRGMLFDGVLNIARAKKPAYISDVSSSIVEDKMRRIAFWKRRAIFAGMLIVTLIINYFI